jgi:hypothetical protein
VFLQDSFSPRDQVIYVATIRGELGSGTYVVITHTDDPTLKGTHIYKEPVQLQSGLDTLVKFDFDIPTGAPAITGIYKFYLNVRTNWPYNSGLYADYINETFTVR